MRIFEGFLSSTLDVEPLTKTMQT